ncbi:MAG: HlyD family efflux transporter periplasmic adaptor subunit, partial [Hyphomicrobium sp.]|nr:HlyD family efflux transporter periplasmic adaptor subunit [Hyphomicrobium sp.]
MSTPIQHRVYALPSSRNGASTARYIRVGYAAMSALLVTFAAASVALIGPALPGVSGTVTVIDAAVVVPAPHGGTVEALWIADGDHVDARQRIAEIGDLEAIAKLTTASREIVRLGLKEARLIAERDGAAQFAAPLDIDLSDPAIKMFFDDEVAEFSARQHGMSDQKTALSLRLANLQRDVDAAAELLQMRLKDRDRNERDLANVRLDSGRNDFRHAQMGELERESVRVSTLVATTKTQIAKLKTELGKVTAQLAELTDAVRRRAVAELGDIRNQFRDARAVFVALSERPGTSTIVAPVSGRIIDLAPFKRGGTITASQILLRIVPDDRTMIVTAPYETSVIAKVMHGDRAIVRYSPNATPSTIEVEGRVRGIDPGDASSNAP